MKIWLVQYSFSIAVYQWGNGLCSTLLPLLYITEELAGVVLSHYCCITTDVLADLVLACYCCITTEKLTGVVLSYYCCTSTVELDGVVLSFYCSIPFWNWLV